MKPYEKVLMALDIWREASGESLSAWRGIMHVIFNRVNHPRWWGHDIVSVITHRWQFSGMTASGDPNLTRWPQVGDIQFNMILSMIDAYDFMEIKEDDPTLGAVFYFSPPLVEPPLAWGRVKITRKFDSITFCCEA